MLVIGFLSAASLILWAQYAIPKSQLIGQTMTDLTMVLQSFIEEHGNMPSDFQELVEKGFIEETDRSVYTIPQSRHTLNYLDEIEVNWAANTTDLALVDGRLVDSSTGGTVYIIRGNSSIFGTDATSKHLSRLLFESLCDQGKRDSNTQFDEQ